MAAYAMWGSVGNQGYAIPLVQLTPTIPATQGYVLAWDTVNQAVNFMPLSFDPATGDATLAGNLGVEVGKAFKVDGTQVVSARQTGWTPFTGATNNGTAYNTATVTLPQLAERVAAIQAALSTHGLIGV